MDGKVRVAVRCRPLIPMEINEGCQKCISFRLESNQVILSDSRQFTFDHVFPPDASQKDVYQQCVKGLIESVFQGFNATVFAYGQTGSGKTFTMGTSDLSTSGCEGVGIIPQVISDLFSRITSLKETHECLVRTSFLEIYNEELHDLLDDPSRTLGIREHSSGGIQIMGLTEFPSEDSKSIFECLNRGADNRTVATTAMNDRSSRSHAILTIHLSIQNRQEEMDRCAAKFHLVDLAGSERVKKTHAEGDRFKEGVNINLGLLALGNVVSALCERESNSAKRTHIPYRDSRLTRILQDSLGGNSHTIMIACVSPADKNYEESLNTLRYADRARQIKNKPIVNRDPQTMEILRLKEIVKQLQSELGSNVTVPSPLPVLDQNMYVEREKFIQLQHENRTLTEELDQAIDRSTALYRQVLQMELLQEQLHQKFDFHKSMFSSMIEDYQTDNQPPNVEDLEEHLKSITELQTNILEIDQMMDNEESAQKEIEPPRKRDLNVTYDQEPQENHDESNNVGDVSQNRDIQEAPEVAEARVQRVALHRELSALDIALRQKERLLANMQANNEEYSKKISTYEEQITELSGTIKKLENEREQMRQQLTKGEDDETNVSVANTTTQNNTRLRLRELESKLTSMRGQVMELKRVKREREQRETECGRLKKEISKLKAIKVRMVRQMAEDSAVNKRWRAAKEMEIRKLQEKDRKMQNELVKVNAEHQRRTAVLKRKMEAAAAAERRLKETMLRQRESVNQRIRRVEGNDKSSINVRIKNWLSEEIEKSVNITEAKKQLENLLEDRKGIAEQLAHARRAGRAENVTEFEGELRSRNERIGNLQKVLSDAELDDQGEKKTRWDHFHSLVEARCGLKFLYKELIQCRSNLREKSSELDEVNDQMRQQEREFHDTQTRLEGQLNIHENKSRLLLKQIEQYLQDNSDLKSRIEHLQNGKPSMEDKGTTLPTPFLPKKKKRMIDNEESEYEEDESLANATYEDPLDFDWRATPFMPKKRQKVSSEVDENTSQVNKCRCRSKCNNRCGCLRKGLTCSDNCSCSSDNCGNRESIASQENDGFEVSTLPPPPVPTENPKRFGGSSASNVISNPDTKKLSKGKRKLLDPRKTIFDSPLLH